MFHVKQKAAVVVIGGGHAGCEAALASARMGVDTVLVTMDASKIAEMSCNPSIGGVGKGQLVKEIDALGGEMGRNADFTGIQFKRLNTRKGSAVQSSRCQSDKRQYAQRMQKVIAEQPNLSVVHAEVKSLRVDSGQIVGLTIQCTDGQRYEVACDAVVITAGTFMRGLMHCGDSQSAGGRAGEGASFGLSDDLARLGFKISRLKTGTPARLLRDSIDFSQMQQENGDEPPKKFSFYPSEIVLPQVSCFLTYTNDATHAAIRENLHRSPLYSGKIQGIGPRYCPSIEDKVVKFPEKGRHQLFFEPEALDSDWIYPNGISTSLPADVQEAFVRTIPGCADVKFARHGYAVEYDCIDPRQLRPTLESFHVEHLFLAGQVNGTSGYEEAAAQGLIAGINAALKCKGAAPFTVSRVESYIGVMLDDLTTVGVTEPYRMFTSRAEYRLSLREDNADLRLSERGHAIGLLPDEHFQMFQERKAHIEGMKYRFAKVFVKPSAALDAELAKIPSPPLVSAQSAGQLLRRPEVGLETLFPYVPEVQALSPSSQECLEIEIKYAGYIQLQKDEIEKLRRMNDVALPEALDYKTVIGLSNEIREKLLRLRPRTLGDAARISGVTPAALTAVLFHVKQKGDDSVKRTLSH